jgi:hypothetical protein
MQTPAPTLPESVLSISDLAATHETPPLRRERERETKTEKGPSVHDGNSPPDLLLKVAPIDDGRSYHEFRVRQATSQVGFTRILNTPISLIVARNGLPLI